MPDLRSNFAFRITTIYLIFGLVWILLTDLLVDLLVPADTATTLQTFKGSIFVIASGVLLFSVVQREVAARNRTEQHLRLLESAIEQIQEGVVITGPMSNEDCPIIEYVNPAMSTIAGYSRDELTGKSTALLVGERADLLGRYLEDMRKGVPTAGQSINYRKDGSSYHSERQTVPLRDADGQISHFVSIHRDVSRSYDSERLLRESEQRFRSLYERNPDGVYALDLEGRITMLNNAAMEMLDILDDGILGQKFHDLVADEVRENAIDRFRRVVAGESLHYDTIYYSRKGVRIEVEGIAAPITINNDVAGVFGVMKDVTRRNRSERQLLTQLRRLDALHAIDHAITTGSELQTTMRLVLSQIVNLLEVDAATIAVVDLDSRILRFDAIHGFDPPVGVPLQIPVAMDQTTILSFSTNLRVVQDIGDIPEVLIHPDLVENEQFVSYLSTPLIAKQRVQGVLELFFRSRAEPDCEWFDMLESLVAQAAIAIDNGTLFEETKRSNEQLSAAYDMTLEGWARALEMRDDETQGHSERVTTATLALARKLGIEGNDLASIRRGSLLHDIGKMAIPDSILSKPAPLSSQEWVIMRRHPVHARTMLEHIPFLRTAIDIPYYHHERWDGSGYPEGLSGTEIPLAARMFAVVDVWDALLSDRPYREAWPAAEVHEHIRRSAGTHFDPDIVAVFLEHIACSTD